MPRYQVSGLLLESDIALPALPSPPHFTFQLCSVPPPALLITAWQDRFDEHGNVWLSVARTATHYVIQFPREALFYVALQTREIFCYPAPATTRETISHLLLDQVLPLLLSQLGKLVLHAGAVVSASGAIAFVGASGAGKSTLTSYFAQQGFPVLTDDFLQLEWQQEIWSFPSYPSLRLFPHPLQNLFAEAQTTAVAAQSEKRRLPLSENALCFHPHPVPLRKIFLLETAPTIKIVPVAPTQQFIALAKNTFHLDLHDLHLWRAKAAAFTRLIEANLLFRLQYPRELNALPDVRNAILAALHL